MDLVLQLVRRRACEPLDDLHVGAVTQAVAVEPDAGLVGQVGGLHDKGTAFPMAARVTQVLANPLTDVRPAVERDDTGVVDHLVADGYFVRGLHDPVAVAVDDWKHRYHHSPR